MERIVSTVMAVGFVVLAVAPAFSVIDGGSVAYAEASDKQINEELASIKKMVADLEKQLATRRMADGATDRTMKMLRETSRSLEQLLSEAPYRGE